MYSYIAAYVLVMTVWVILVMKGKELPKYLDFVVTMAGWYLLILAFGEFGAWIAPLTFAAQCFVLLFVVEKVEKLEKQSL